MRRWIRGNDGLILRGKAFIAGVEDVHDLVGVSAVTSMREVYSGAGLTDEMCYGRNALLCAVFCMLKRYPQIHVSLHKT